MTTWYRDLADPQPHSRRRRLLYLLRAVLPTPCVRRPNVPAICIFRRYGGQLRSEDHHGCSRGRRHRTPSHGRGYCQDPGREHQGDRLSRAVFVVRWQASIWGLAPGSPAEVPEAGLPAVRRQIGPAHLCQPLRVVLPPAANHGGEDLDGLLQPRRWCPALVPPCPGRRRHAAVAAVQRTPTATVWTAAAFRPAIRVGGLPAHGYCRRVPRSVSGAPSSRRSSR